MIIGLSIVSLRSFMQQHHLDINGRLLDVCTLRLGLRPNSLGAGMDIDRGF